MRLRKIALFQHAINSDAIMIFLIFYSAFVNLLVLNSMIVYYIINYQTD